MKAFRERRRGQQRWWRGQRQWRRRQQEVRRFLERKERSSGRGRAGGLPSSAPGARARAGLAHLCSPSGSHSQVPGPEVPRGRPGRGPRGTTAWQPSGLRVPRAGGTGGRKGAQGPKAGGDAAQAPWVNDPGVTAARCLMGEAGEALRTDWESAAASKEWRDARRELTLLQPSPLRSFFLSWI